MEKIFSYLIRPLNPIDYWDFKIVKKYSLYFRIYIIIHCLKRFVVEKNLIHFQEALKIKGLPKASFVISSALRTEEQQAQLRSVKHSAHSYGASFDIFKIQSVGSCEQARSVFQAVLQRMRKNQKLYLCPESDHLHLTVR